MDIGLELISAILRGGDTAFRFAMERGVTSDGMLVGDSVKVWSFVVDYKRTYGALPTMELAREVTSVAMISEVGGDHRFWLEKALERRLRQVLAEGRDHVDDLLKANDVKGASEAWKEIHRKVQREHLSISKIEPLFSLGRKAWEDYEAVKAGKRGIPTPWPTIDDQTLGWQPEDLIVVMGRQGSGKTWALLIIANVAFRAGYRVLIASTEMARMKVVKRFLALYFKVPYHDFQHGKLGEFLEEKTKRQIEENLEAQGIYIVGGDFDFTIDNLEGAIEDSDAQLACVDGAYLVKNAGKDRHERVSNTFDDLKRIGKRRQMANVASTQFNRSAKSSDEKSIIAENAGITDVIGWNADAMYGLWQNSDMYTSKRQGFKTLKVREGRLEDFLANWDFQRMDFSEIREDGREGFSDTPAVATPVGPESYDDIPF